ATLYTSAEALRIATALLAPVLPESTEKIWRQLGMSEPLESVRLDAPTWAQLQAGEKNGGGEGGVSGIRVKKGVAKKRVLEAGEGGAGGGRGGEGGEGGAGGGGGGRPACPTRQWNDRYRGFLQGRSSRRLGALRRARQRRR